MNIPDSFFVRRWRKTGEVSALADAKDIRDFPGIPHGGKLHEIYAPEMHDAGGALGFAVLMLQSFRDARPVFWLRRRNERGVLPYASGLTALDIDPGEIVFVMVRNNLSLLRAAADAARCPGVGAILIEAWGRLPEFDLTASRRLLLAAERSGATIFIMRTGPQSTSSAAETRWRISAAPSRPAGANAPGRPAFAAHLLRHRSGPAGMTWRLEWNRERACFQEAPLSGAVVPASAGGSAALDHGAVLRFPRAA